MNLGAYLQRIGVADSPAPTLRCLEACHYGHVTHIPFENLDPLRGQPVSLALAAVEQKLVHAQRGGYCFEHNRLFAEALGQAGFSVTPLAARVVWNVPDGHTNPRTHMVLAVRCEGAEWLCDAGFGGGSLTAPLRLETGVEQATPHDTYRLRDCAEGFELAVRIGDQWRPMYRFDRQPQQPRDYDMANHWVQTHPESFFHSKLVAARAFAGGRYALDNIRFTTYSGDDRTVEALSDADALRAVLETRFGIRVPPDPVLDRTFAVIVRSAGRD